MNVRLLFFYLLFFILPMANAQFFLNGPDAPLVSIGYSANGYVLTLDNPPNSNNYNELYQEADPDVPNPNDPAQHWYFQGYRIYQVLNDSVDIFQLNNSNLARQIAQSDIQDSITDLVNYVYNPLISNCLPVQMVNGSNMGSQLVYTLQTDLFSNQQPFHPDSTYCFIVVSYASNLFHTAGSLCVGLPHEYIESTKTPMGSIQTHCVTGSALSVPQYAAQDGPLFYPNPSTGIVHINFPQSASLRVYDGLGRVVHFREIKNGKELDLSNYPKGIYTIEFIGNEGGRKAQQLVLK